MAKDTYYCSFCGKSQHEVRKLIAGPGQFICDECVELCMDICRGEYVGASVDGVLEYESWFNDPLMLYANRIGHRLIGDEAFDDGLIAGRVEAYGRIVALSRKMPLDQLRDWIRAELAGLTGHE